MKRQKRLLLLLLIGIVCSYIIVLSACSPQQNDGQKIAEGATTQEADFSWSPDADCSMCHTKENDSLQDASCQISTNHSSVACIECHSDEDALRDSHADVTLADTQGAKRLKNTEVSQDACLACHTDFDQIKQMTSNSTALVDSRGTVVNPHNMPSSESHDSLVCSTCHTMHSNEPIQETAKNACLSCHHADVFECNTCHTA